MMTVQDLIEKVKKYNPKADTKLIEKAYKLAEELHVKQYRKSGELFIAHPLEVADILADLEMDTPTIIAALLHDAVEDTTLTLNKIEKEFGKEVALLIDGVTKLGQIEFKTQEEAQAENLRKMLIAMAKDIRVILIKLADRLHNMRTVSHLPEEKQRQKAKETLEIYAPLAHRLGISSLKWELEDLSFAVLEPKKYNQIQKMVNLRMEERKAYLDTVIKTLERELGKVDIKAEFSGRTKHFYSIYQKMIQRGKDFNEIYDLTAVRVLVKTVKDCYAALGAIHALWKPVPGRFKDYIAMPKFNMYQSLHTTVIGPEGRPLEIQIRSSEMHKTAEYGIAAHWRYKEKQTETDKFEERLSWLRQMLEWQKELRDPKEFMQSLRVDLFGDEVFVFTPKGRVISLPIGATPIDFAYAIHTDVGHSLIGAKVNNQIVSLEYELKMGDIVEILTSKTASGPSKDWLSMVKTSRARNKIRQWFSKEEREDSQHLGREILLKAIHKQKLKLPAQLQNKLLEELAKVFNFASVDYLYASIGTGKTSPKEVINKLIKAVKDKEETKELPFQVTPHPRRVTPSVSKGIKVKGVDDVLVRLAHCCNPVSGDDIVGFVTQGRGVSVHRQDCPNAKQFLENPDRLVEVSWDASRPVTFQVEIQVEALDRTKLLRDVSTAISDAGVNILAASVATGKDHTAIFRFVFEVSSLSHLEDILKNIKRIDTVFDAYRVVPTAK